MTNTKAPYPGPDLRPYRPYGIGILKLLSMIAITAGIVTVAYNIWI